MNKKASIFLSVIYVLLSIVLIWGMALIAGLGAYALIIFFTGSFKFAMLAGLIGAAAGGYLGGSIFGDSGDGGY